MGGVAGSILFYYHWQKILEYALGAGIIVLLVYNAVKKVTSYESSQVRIPLDFANCVLTEKSLIVERDCIGILSEILCLL